MLIVKALEVMDGHISFVMFACIGYGIHKFMSFNDQDNQTNILLLVLIFVV